MDFNLRFGFYLAAMMALSAVCFAASPLDTTVPCASGLAAFQKNLYKPILRVACMDCHDTAGPGPAHSTIDPAASYAMIKTYVNFAQLSQSRIIQHVQTKHWVNIDPSATGCSVDDMTTALQNWWDQGEKDCPSAETAQTETTLIPAGLPLFPQQAFVPMTWKLDALGPNFVGAEFQVEIQQLALPTSTSAGAYRLRKPRFATSQTGLSVEGIHFFINGKAQETANGWEHLGAQIAGHDLDSQAPVLSGREVIALQDQATGDSLSVAFNGIQIIAKPECKNLAAFQAKILPVIQQSSCVSCHSGGEPSHFNGSSRLLLSGADADVCSAVRERITSTPGAPSPFVQIAFSQANDHPPTDQPPSAFNQDWKNWVAGEAK